MIPFLLLILFILGTGTYSYFGFKASLLPEGRSILVIYIIMLVLIIIGIVLLLQQVSSGYGTIKTITNILFGLAFSLIIANLLSSVLFLFEDLIRGFLWIVQSVFHFKLVEVIPRTYISGFSAFLLSGFSILLINYGVLFGRYHFKTHQVTLEYEDLPASFDGFRIAQISDMHLGTFDQIKRFQKGLDQLQAQNPDLIVFTGDMVNSIADEANRFIESFKALHAPYGKLSILGNHDYGDYYRWNSQQAKTNNLSKLKRLEKEMGFKMLNNQHTILHKNYDSIVIAGVENWGLPPFPQQGDLQTALKGLNTENFIVLLSHDPTHWSEIIVNSPIKVALTLSGHTHGMQVGIEAGKFRWSPVKYRYHDWAGLYTDHKSKLYVNRGYGSIGYPGRIGIWPEITIIELRKKKVED